MRVLLISGNTETIHMPVLPVGLACVSAACTRAGHETRILNLMSEQAPGPVLQEVIPGFAPHVIGISLRNIDDQNMSQPSFLAEKVRPIVAACRRLADAPIVLGGAGYSIFPKASLSFLKADMGIRGEGEAAFVQLIDRLSRNAPVSDVPGLYLPQTGCLQPRTFIKDPAGFFPPEPDRDLPIPAGYDRSELWLPFQTRRGCPMACSYCSTGAIEGQRIRKIPPALAAETLSRYAAAGFTRFFFVDNTFNLPPRYAEALCDAIIQKRLAISWRSIVYPWKITARLADKMAKAGCVEVSLGFESGADEVLESFNKRFRARDARLAAQHFGARNISRMGFLLLGGPAETRETVRQSLCWADSLGLESMKLTVGIRIYPETALAQKAAAEGLVAPDDDLLFPRFYVRPQIKDWLVQEAGKWAAKRKGWVF